eukprot:PhM_4_TR8800/c0_g1_i2/m.48275/K08855/GAK; cyclin G-associated kinase
MGACFGKDKSKRDRSLPATLAAGGTHLQCMAKVGEGAYAVVYQCRDPFSNQCFAVKRILVGDVESQAMADLEVDCLRHACPHPNIVELRSSEIVSPTRDDPGQVLIATEYCAGKLIDELIRVQAAGQHLPIETVYRVASDVVCALAHLHSLSPPIAHRDLKPENILSKDGLFKLCDFGSATRVAYEPTTPQEITR